LRIGAQGGCVILARVLKAGCVLQELSLGKCKIRSPGAIAIFRALTHNRHLTHLYLSVNTKTEKYVLVVKMIKGKTEDAEIPPPINIPVSTNKRRIQCNHEKNYVILSTTLM